MKQKQKHKNKSKDAQLKNDAGKKTWNIVIITSFIVSIIIFFKFTLLGIDHSIIEQHGFRQTQTGLTALYFIKEGFKLNYITPFYGYPWTVPMEFPFYQYCVALLVKLTAINLDVAGRITSLFFFYMSLIPIYGIIKLITKDKIAPLVIMIVLFLHPLIIYWSRTFLIESAAVFLNLTYLWLGLKLLYEEKRILYFIIIVLSFIAPISKSTTGLIHLACLGVFYLDAMLIEIRDIKIAGVIKKYITRLIIVFGFPLLVTIAWTKYTDNIKSENFTSSFWISTLESAKDWNFGTLDQKLDINTWKQIDGFEFHLILITIIVSILALLLKLSHSKKIFFFTLAGISGPLIFTNLYYVHDYYSYANSVFYCMSLGLFCANLIFEYKNQMIKLAGGVVLSITAYYLYNSYTGSFYYNMQKQNNTYFKQIGQNLKQYISDEESFIFYGYIGDPFVPYYAERKAVCMMPYYVDIAKKDPIDFFKKIEKSNIKAMVVCDGKNQDVNLINKTIEYFNMNPQPVNNDIEQMGYYIFLSNDKQSTSSK